MFYEILDIHRLFEPTILDDYPNLKVAFLVCIGKADCVISCPNWLLGVP